VSVLSLGVEVSGVSSIVESRSQGIGLSECQSFVVLECQGALCRDTGAVVGESTLLLDFERLIQNVNSLLQAFRGIFQLQMTKDDPLSIAMK
jgi:hypothetical protein